MDEKKIKDTYEWGRKLLGLSSNMDDYVIQ
jgi:hypothetical protein